MIDRIYLERQRKKLFGTRRSTLRSLSYVATGLFVLTIGSVLFVGLLFAWYAKDLPRPDNVKRSDGLSTVILDRSGENLYDIFVDENRLPLKFEDIPQYCRDATVAIEDKDFYTHQGLSTGGIARALINIFVFHNFQGGSTLTQQLVKTVLLTSERTLPRKIKEAILAIQIERKYTKDEILQMYLNEVPFGGTAVGLESASQNYFGKKANELSLVECAILSGFPQSPSRYSPFTGEEKAYVWRAEQVLRRMREDGHITALTEAEARSQLDAVVFAEESVSLRAPHFVAYVKDLLVEKFGAKAVEGGGLKVTTTLDWQLQEKAQTIVAEEVDKAKKLKVSNGAAVVIDPTSGEILTMVGSRDYQASDAGGFKFNVATQGLRQPGSSIKPITYAAAFSNGYTPSTLLMDVETKYPSGDPDKPEYNPKNYDGKYRGPMQLRAGLGNSVNTVAVKVSALVGVRDILSLAHQMGINSLEPSDDNLKRIGLSLTLGGGEVTLLDLTSAFGVFAAGGMRQDPVAILKVEDASGKVLFEHNATQPRRVLGADVAYLVSNILSDNTARNLVFGPNSYLVISGKSVAVKTGTTDDKRDNWTLGYITKRVVGVWVGNNDNSPMHPSLASGVTGAAPIWNRIMRELLKEVKDEPFARPDNIIEMDIDAYAGGLPVDGGTTRKDFFIRGTEPTTLSPIYKDIKVSKRDSSKLANAVEIIKGEYDTKRFYVFTELDPVSTDGSNRWQQGIDAWVNSQGDSKFHPPGEVFQGGDDKVSVRIKEPGNESQINANSIMIRVEAAGLSDISRIEVYVDGSKVKEASGKNFAENVDVPNGSYRTIKAKAIASDGNTAETEVHIGVNEPYATPTPAPTDTPSPTP